MRILLLFCCCFFFTTMLSAQYEGGNWYLSADTQLGDTETYLGDGFKFGGVGLFVRDRLLVGTRLETGNSFRGFRGGDLWVNPFARYYFPSEKPNLSFFAEAGAGLGFGRQGGSSLTAAFGAEYQLAPGVMLTGSLEYTSRNANNTDRLGLNLGLNVILGERYRPEGRYDFLHRRGTLMLNGSIGNLSINNIGGQTSLLGNVDLEAAYFLSERFALEGKLVYAAGYLDLGTESSPRKYMTRDVEVSLGGSYFFLPGRSFQPYVGGGLSYENGGWRETTADPERTSSYSTFSANLNAGFLHHLNDRVAIDFNLGYRKSFYGDDFRGLTGGVGLKVFLGKNRR